MKIEVSELTQAIETSVSTNSAVIDVGVSDNQQGLSLDVDAQQQIVVATNKHDELINRELENQHPMSAITGLKKELDNKLPTNKLVAITNREIDAICV